TSVILPKPTGFYAVGTKAIELKDLNRKMLRDFTQRRWMVQAFYPTDLQKDKTYPYMPGTLKEGLVGGTYVYAHSKTDADLSKTKAGCFPIIIFIPGIGGGRQDYTILCEELASYGYVVLSIDQPYVSNFVCFLDKIKIVPTFKDIWKVKQNRDYRYAYYDE